MRPVRRRGRSAVVAVLVVAFFMAGVQPVSAHDRLDSHSYWAVRNTAGDLCVKGAGSQNHAYHRVETRAYTQLWGFQDCSSQSSRPGGNIIHRAEFYTSGYGPCYRWGWDTNGGSGYGILTEHFYDVWYRGCGYTPGVHTYITMDIWNYVWNPRQGDSGAWVGGFARPITGHCHCP